MAIEVNTDILPVIVPADHVAGPPQGQWTYAAYAALPDDGQRYEMIEGTLYMAPALGEAHQSVHVWLIYYLMTHVQVTGLGRVYSARLMYA